MTRPDWRNAAAVGALAAVSVVFFGRFLLRGQTFAYDDLAFWFFPWKALLYKMAHQGHVSFWLPWEFCGMPHMADIQRQIFYPPNAVFYLVPTGPAMVIFFGLHFFIATVLMFAWLRNIRAGDPLDVPSALCGALVFGFSSFPVLHASQLPMLASYVWIPGLLLCEERYWRDSAESGRISAPWLAGGAVFFCLMLLGGAPQMVYIGSFLAAMYGVFLVATSPEVPRGRALKTAALALAVPVFGMGLAGLQLAPMAELTTWTTREPAVSSEYSSIGTAEPAMLWTFVAPYVFGNPADGTWRGGYTFHEQCFYVGLVTLVLCAAAFGDPRRGGLRLGFFTIVALLGVVIALGNHVQVGGVGLHDVFRKVLPLFGKFRVPPRWSALTVVGTSVLAAFGANALARYRPPHQRQSAEGAAPLALSFGALFLFGGLLLQARGAEYAMPVAQAKWAFLLLFSTLVCGAIGRVPSWSTWGALGLVAMLAIDLLSFGGQYVRGEGSPALSPNLQIVRDLAASPSTGRVITHTATEIPTQVATWCGPLGLDNIQGTNPLFLRPYIDYLYYSQAAHVPDPGDTGYMHHNGFFLMTPVVSPMTRVLNLTDVIEVERDDEARGRTWTLTDGTRLWDRKVSGALGEAWAVPGYVVLPREEDVLRKMRDDSWDPESEAILSDVPGLSMPPPKGRVKARIRVERRGPDEVTVSATVDRDALLMFSEIYYPGWTCTVDGVATPILQADAILRAVAVMAGTHRVTMRYRPRSFLAGLLVTLGTALVLAVMVLRRRRG